ncbi:ribonuclease HII [Pontimonas sp.]|nr:ribonuclease HII [Pontimonas sp.]MDA8862831.1 ribonuclease HII [Pontimonas sp.]
MAQGFTSVIGCDEVGRGPLAGPVVAGLVVWTADILTWPEGLYDSKTVTEKRRGPLAEALRETFPQHALGESSAEVVDQEGIQRALALAVVEGLLTLAQQGVAIGTAVLLLDGSHDFVTPHLPHPLRVVTRVKGDRDCVSVAAASVLAKVYRDEAMIAHHETYPEYGFESNKGYGSKSHIDAIAQHGITPLHRASWIKK